MNTATQVCDSDVAISLLEILGSPFLTMRVLTRSRSKLMSPSFTRVSSLLEARPGFTAWQACLAAQF